MNAALILFLLFVSLAWTSAHAQINYPTAGGVIPTDVVGPYSQYPPSYNPYLNNAQQNTVTTATANGVQAKITGEATVRTAGGTAVKVPVSQTANISKAAIAKAASKAIAKATPFVGTAYAIGEFLAEMNDKGYRLGPDGRVEGPEQPGIPGDPAGTGYGIEGYPQYNSRSPETTCNGWASWKAGISGFTKDGWSYRTELQNNGTVCRNYYTHNVCTGCAQTEVQYIKKITNYYTPGFRPIDEAQIHADAMARLESHSGFSKRMYDALKRDEGVYEGAWPGDYNPLKANNGIDFGGLPVSTSPQVVSTTTATRPDGSIDTTTVSQWMTITPTATGTTYGDQMLSFPSTQTQQSQTTNSVTGQTTTSTSVVTNPTVTPSTTPSTGTPDTGPRECGSPGRPKCQIDETGTATATGALDPATAALDTAIDGLKTTIQNSVTDTGKDTSLGWMPTIPEGTCQEVSFTLPIPGGRTVTSDVCKYIPPVTLGFELLWSAFFGFAVMGLVASATAKNHA
ncbi:hypothetical protein [uncultured Oxalicibacterium sp.]|uniref:hypothetical protein n=1 Tax=uncultured Oxalicibacterium sp. TaxID=1168540 RepID=UPI0025EF8200|nr:hypothetical protein [uncultured Oxalicibacterium sp.]